MNGRNLDAVATDLEDGIAEVKFPLEYHAEVLGDYNDRQSDERVSFIGVSVAAALGIFLLLQAAFGSWRLASVLFVALPGTLAGGVLAAVIDGDPISIGTFAGFLALFGLATRSCRRHSFDTVSTLRMVKARRFGPDLVAQRRPRPAGPHRDECSGELGGVRSDAVLRRTCGLRGGAPDGRRRRRWGRHVHSALQLIVVPALYLRFGGHEPTLSPEEELMQRWADVAPAEETVERAPVT